MARYDDLSGRSITLVGLLSVMIVVIVILGCQVLYYALTERQVEQKQLYTEYRQSDAYLNQQRERLQRSGTELREEGDQQREYRVVSIDEAMRSVVQERGQEGDAQAPRDES